VIVIYLEIAHVLNLHDALITASGGSTGVRDRGGLDSAIAQPQMTFGGHELYPTIVEKAAALGFSLIMNHPFIDGNKRIGHAAMEVFLICNGFEIQATVDEQEAIILQVAAGQMGRDAFVNWLQSHVVPVP
jgi:death-on-curing protein